MNIMKMLLESFISCFCIFLSFGLNSSLHTIIVHLVVFTVSINACVLSVMNECSLICYSVVPQQNWTFSGREKTAKGSVSGTSLMSRAAFPQTGE